MVVGRERERKGDLGERSKAEEGRMRDGVVWRTGEAFWNAGETPWPVARRVRSLIAQKVARRGVFVSVQGMVLAEPGVSIRMLARQVLMFSQWLRASIQVSIRPREWLAQKVARDGELGNGWTGSSQYSYGSELVAHLLSSE